MMQTLQAVAHEHLGYQFVTMELGGTYYVVRCHPENQEKCHVNLCQSEQEAKEQLDWEMGYLYFWSDKGYHLPHDASESFAAGWDAAGFDANERAKYLEHQSMYEEQRNGWMT
jgi:hypothetical protein